MMAWVKKWKKELKMKWIKWAWMKKMAAHLANR